MLRRALKIQVTLHVASTAALPTSHLPPARLPHPMRASSPPPRCRRVGTAQRSRHWPSRTWAGRPQRVCVNIRFIAPSLILLTSIRCCAHETTWESRLSPGIPEWKPFISAQSSNSWSSSQSCWTLSSSHPELPAECENHENAYKSTLIATACSLLKACSKRMRTLFARSFQSAKLRWRASSKLPGKTSYPKSQWVWSSRAFLVEKLTSSR